MDTFFHTAFFLRWRTFHTLNKIKRITHRSGTGSVPKAVFFWDFRVALHYVIQKPLAIAFIRFPPLTGSVGYALKSIGFTL